MGVLGLFLFGAFAYLLDLVEAFYYFVYFLEDCFCGFAELFDF